MKIIKKSISAKDGSGSVLFRPEINEDLWHAYNLLQIGDLVRCTTLRKVIKESSTGSTTSSKKRLTLTVEVSKVEFDPDTLQVRLSGITTSESDHVRLGSHHTLTLELFQNFSIEKDVWDQIFLDRLEEATHPERQADIAAVVLQMGLAHVCLVTGELTITKARIEKNIPKKRTGSSAHGKAVEKFFDAVYQAILRHIDFFKVKCVLVASPGFVKDDLFQFIQQNAVKREDKALIDNKDKFVLCKASSGHKFALDEVFSDQAIMARMTETKVAKEVDILNRFMRMMDVDPDRAYYGYQHVVGAHEELAIESLLITDELFRNSNAQTRKQYVQLVESVRESGGQVHIFSSMHVSGQQLQQVSGVAAILRYPLPDLEQIEQDAAQFAAMPENGYNDDNSEDEYYDTDKQMREDMEGMGF